MENGLINFLDILETKRPFNFSEIIYFLKYLTDTLELLQRHHIAHRDIKPSNIVLFLKKNGEIVANFCDFSSGAITKDEENNLLSYDNIALTLDFSAPELQEQQGKSNYSPYKADVYSLGIVILKMINSEYGKRDLEKSDFLESLSKNTEYKQLIPILKNMLDKNPELRYDFIKLKESLVHLTGVPPKDLFFLIKLSLLKKKQINFKQAEGRVDELEKLDLLLKESYMFYCVHLWFCRNEMLEISYLLTILCGKRLIERSEGYNFPNDAKYIFNLLKCFYLSILSSSMAIKPKIWQFTVAELGSYENYEEIFRWSEFSSEMSEKELKEKLLCKNSCFIQSLGIYFLRIKQYEKALICFELIEKKEIINKVHALNSKGCIFFQKEQKEEAIDCFEKSLKTMSFIKEQKQNPLILCIFYRNLMALYSKTNNLTEFRNNCDKLIENLINSFGKSHFTILLSLLNFFCIKELKKNESKRNFDIFIPKLKELLLTCESKKSFVLNI